MINCFCKYIKNRVNVNFAILECPLYTEGRDGVEALCYKVVGELYLATNAQIEVLALLDSIEVKPQLRLGDKDV